MKSLYQLRGVWRDQIFKDAELSHAAFRLGYGLAAYMTLKDTEAEYRNSGKIEVFPSQEALSEDSSVSPATIRVSIAQLIQRGHLEQVRRGNQHSGSNRYRILIKRRGEPRYRPQVYR